MTRDERLKRRLEQEAAAKIQTPSGEPSRRNQNHKFKKTNSENNVILQGINEKRNNLRYKRIVQLQAPLDRSNLESDPIALSKDRRINNKYSIYNYDNLNNINQENDVQSKLTPARNYQLYKQEKQRFQRGSNEISRTDNFGDRKESDIQTNNNMLDSEMNSQQPYDQSYISESNLDNAPEVKKFKGNYLMERLAKDREALRIGANNPEAKFNHPDVDSPETKHFSYKLPSKIPLPTKVLKSGENQNKAAVNEFHRSPKAKRILNNEIDMSPGTSAQKQMLAQTMAKHSKKGTYLESLKHKFSPIVEDSQAQIKAKLITASETNQNKRAKQPSQQKYARKKWKEDPNEGNFAIKSEEQSKKNILKVASTLKKKLKHNFAPAAVQRQEESEEEVWESQNLMASAPRQNRAFTSVGQYEDDVVGRRNYATPSIYNRNA